MQATFFGLKSFLSLYGCGIYGVFPVRKVYYILMRYFWIQLRFKAVLALFLTVFAVNSSAEPTIQVLSAPEHAILGEIYPIQLQVTWEGPSTEYSSLPPHIEVSDWADLNSLTSTSVKGDQNSINHTLQIRPRKTGQFTISELLVPYFKPTQTSTAVEMDSELAEYPTLNAGMISINVIESSDSLVKWLGMGVVGLILAAIAWAYSRRKVVQVATLSHRESSIPGIVHQARKHRLDGYHYKFFQEMLRGAGLLSDSPDKKHLQQRFEELTLAIGYKGMVPTDDDMDSAIRELERAHKQEN